MTPWRVRLRSVRVRLTAWYLVTLLAALLLYAVGIYSFLWQSLLGDLDRRLHADVEEAEQVVTLTPAGAMAWRPLVQGDHDEDREEEEQGAIMPAIQIWSQDGRFLTQRLTRRTGAVAETLMTFPDAVGQYATVRLADGTHVRTLTRRVQISGTSVVMRVIRSEEPVRSNLRALLLVLLLGLPVAIGLAGTGGYFLARRALQPVGRIAERARSITAERLSERVPVDNPDDELGQLAVILNSTFARLERSFDQMRRFTADASHELRTPLTAIRSVGEVALEEPHEASSYRDVIGNMLEETDRLARLVDSLLLLSRADAGQVVFHKETADLVALAREVVAHLGVLAEEKEQEVRVRAEEAVEARVDRAVIRQALINLLDNAIKYGPTESEIRVDLRVEGPWAVLDVVDHGPGIPAEHAARIFDRFYRVDAARTRDEGGAGLGLSIAWWGVESQGGTLRLLSSGAGETRFRMTLPHG